MSPHVDLPIDLIPNTHPPRFRWKHAVVTPIGQKTVECTGIMLPGVEDALITLIALTKKVTLERDNLQAFKDWVHAYLDAHGVPHHPPGNHGAAGCRIGDRMDWVFKCLSASSKEQALEAEIKVLKQQIEGLHAQLVAGTEHVIDLKDQLGKAKRVLQSFNKGKS